ncbi:hypothetical protein D3C87_1561330 [compost metagenome]
MGMLMKRFGIENNRHSILASLPLVLMPQQVFISDDICPMVTTRVMYAQQNLAESRQSRQGLQGLCRKRRDPEHDYP